MIGPAMLAMAYGGYSALRLSSELRYLNDYKKRYPWVSVRYPGRTAAFKSVGGVIGSFGPLVNYPRTYPGMNSSYCTSYDPVRYMYG